MPLLHLLAGPNGAGKSSYVHDVLMPATHVPFINADDIAGERRSGAQVEHAYQAARIAEAQRRDCITEGASFISNTVFSHPSKWNSSHMPWMPVTSCIVTSSSSPLNSPCSVYSSACVTPRVEFRSGFTSGGK